MFQHHEDRLKYLKDLLKQTLDLILDEEISIEETRSKKYKMERGLLLLKANKNALKKEAIIVNVAAYKIVSEDLKKVEKKFNELKEDFDKKTKNLEKLYDRENYILDEIDLTEKTLDLSRAVISYDFINKRRV